MNHSAALRITLKKCALSYAANQSFSFREYNSAIVFENIENNFNKHSYDVISKNRSYSIRLEKKHSFFTDGTKEMQSSASSDALLMNIFCYPRIKNWKGIKLLLNISELEQIEFGFIPNIESINGFTKTEIDMKIGNVFFEAKLTEGTFTKKDYKLLIEKYPDAQDTFDLDYLLIDSKTIGNYQLIRNVLTAKKYDGRFILLLDARRTDLIREFYHALRSVKSKDLREKISFITWQEISDCIGEELKSFLKGKYGL